MTLNLHPVERNEVPFDSKWTLLPTNKIPGFHQEIGKVTFSDDDNRSWSVSLDMSGGLALFTDLPHPDNPQRRQIWRYNPWPDLKIISNELVRRDEERQSA